MATDVSDILNRFGDQPEASPPQPATQTDVSGILARFEAPDEPEAQALGPQQTDVSDITSRFKPVQPTTQIDTRGLTPVGDAPVIIKDDFTSRQQTNIPRLSQEPEEFVPDEDLLKQLSVGKEFVVGETARNIAEGFTIPLAKGGQATIGAVGGLLEFLGTKAQVLPSNLRSTARDLFTFPERLIRGIAGADSSVTWLEQRAIKKRREEGLGAGEISAPERNAAERLLTNIARKVEGTGEKISEFSQFGRGVLEAIRPTKKLFSTNNGKLKFSTNNMKNPEFWTDAFLEAFTSMSQAFISGGQTTVGAAIAGSLMEAGPYYSELKKNDDPNAEEKAVAFGLAVAGLEKIGFEKMFKGKGKNIILKAIVASMTEGGTEWAEEPIGTLIDKLGTKGITLTETGEAVVQSMKDGLNAIPGALLSAGGTSISTSLGEVQAPEEATPPTPISELSQVQEQEGQTLDIPDTDIQAEQAPIAAEEATTAPGEQIPTETEEAVVEPSEAPEVTEEAKVLEEAVEKGETTFHKMPDGTTMPGAEHEGSVKDSQFEATKADIQDIIQEKEPITAPVAEEGKQKILRLTKAEDSHLREELGLATLQPAKRESVEFWVNIAKEQKLDESAEDRARDLLANPRVEAPAEHIGAVLRTAQLKGERTELLIESDRLKKQGDNAEAVIFDIKIDEVNNKLDLLTRADRLVASPESGRAFLARQIGVGEETFTVEGIIRDTETQKGKEVSEGESKRVRKLSRQVQSLQANQAKLQSQFDIELEKRAKKKAEKIVAEIRKEETAGTRKSRRGKPSLEAQKAAVKAKLAKLAVRLNDITGLPFEVSVLIGELAKINIQQGARTLSDVIDAVKADVPDISSRDIMASISNQGKKAKKHIQTELQKRQKDLKAQAKVMTEAIDIINGEEVKSEKPEGTASQELKDIRESKKVIKKGFKALNRLTLSASRQIKDEARYQKIMDKIENVKNLLGEGLTEEKKKQRIDPENIRIVKRELTEVRDIMNTKEALRKTDETIDKINRGDFTDADIAPARKQRIISSELDEARVALRLKKREIKNFIESRKPPSALDIIGLPGSLVRALQTSGDLSSIMRQNFMFALGHPVKTFGFNTKALKAAMSEMSAEALQLMQEAQPAHAVGRASGLNFESIDGPLTEVTEDLTTKYLDSIPVFKQIFTPFIKASGRHFVSFGNQVKLEYFKMAIAANPTMTTSQMAHLAEGINIITGRPSKIAFGAISGKGFGVLGFAPKFAWSRVAFLPTLGAGVANKATRKLTSKEIGRSSAGFIVLLSLAAAMGYEIDDDPESVFFGRVLIGNTWVDLSGGVIPTFQRIVIAPTLQVLNKRGVREMHNKYLASRGPMDSWLTWLKYKAGPSVTVPVTLATGENVIGQKQTAGETLLKSVTTLVAQEAYDISQSRLASLPEKAGLTALAFLGFSTTTLDDELRRPSIKKIFKHADYFPSKPAISQAKERDEDDSKSLPEWVKPMDKHRESINIAFSFSMGQSTLKHKKKLMAMDQAELKEVLREASSISRQAIAKNFPNKKPISYSKSRQKRVITKAENDSLEALNTFFDELESEKIN